MQTATLTPQLDGDLLLESPRRQLPASRRSIMANVRGRRVEVYVGSDGQLWYYNTYRDAEDFDERPGQITAASHPSQCIQWLRAYTPRGVEQERLIEYYTLLNFQAYWQQRLAQFQREAERVEQEQREEATQWFLREEERLRQEEAALEFPLETESDIESEEGYSHED